MPQVAGSALAAVAAAVLASQLGVYGTIVGAGVVSVVATCGGPVFQHFFRRTGEQLREVTVQAKPKGRQVPLREVPGDPRDPGSGVWMLPQTTGLNEEFGEPTTHGTRIRRWKRPAVAAAVAFVVAMIGITGFELASGKDLSGDHGTTVGSVVGGGGGGSPRRAPADTPSPDLRPSPPPDNGRATAPGRQPGGTPSAGAGQDGDAPSGPPTQSPPPTDGATGPAVPGSHPARPTPTPTPTPSNSPGDFTGSGHVNGGGGEPRGALSGTASR